MSNSGWQPPQPPPQPGQRPSGQAPSPFDTPTRQFPAGQQPQTGPQQPPAYPQHPGNATGPAPGQAPAAGQHAQPPRASGQFGAAPQPGVSARPGQFGGLGQQSGYGAPGMSHAPGAYAQPGAPGQFAPGVGPPGAVAAPRRRVPLWGWLTMGAAAVAIVALVAVLVVPGLFASSEDGDSEAAVLTFDGNLGLSEAVSVNADPIFDVDRGADWSAGGVFFDDGLREEQFPYDGGGECVALTTVETGVSEIEGKNDDNEATRIALEAYGGGSPGGTSIDPEVVEVPTYGGGSMEMQAMEAKVSLGSGTWASWIGARAFTGSGIFVSVNVLCQNESDLGDAAADFQERVSLVLDVA